jgi:hypothetical protein
MIVFASLNLILKQDRIYTVMHPLAQLVQLHIFDCLHVGGSVISAVLRSRSDNNRIFLVFKSQDFLQKTWTSLGYVCLKQAQMKSSMWFGGLFYDTVSLSNCTGLMLKSC